jgi:parallel beta-helix repeat protein
MAMQRWLVGLCALLSISCGGGDGNDLTQPEGVSLEIKTTTAGELSGAGYTVRIDDGALNPIGTNATIVLTDLTQGSHSVQLSGLGQGCTVAGENPRIVDVSAQGTTSITFSINCASPASTIQVVTASSGSAPVTYTIVLDGTNVGAIGSAAIQSFTGISTGLHSVGLSDVPSSCHFQGQNPQNVTVATGTTAIVSFAISCPPLPEGIMISPGQSLQAMVTANPGGTTFILKAGTHTGQSVVPKSGDSFIGEPGAVLDGQGVLAYAFAGVSAPYPSDVTVRGLRITGYEPRFQHGAVDAGGSSPSEGTTGWVIDNNEVSYNGEYGIRIGSSTRVTNNKVHHNKRLNMGGNGNSTLIAGNEIAFGHYLNNFDTDFEAGGAKFTYTDSLLFRDNYVHDNVGVGLHMDLNDINTVIEGNQIEHNGSEGIAIEISYKTTIRHNTVINNGWFDPRSRYTYLWNAGIGIKASPDVEVYGNTVSGNYAGIVAIDQDRSIDPAHQGPHITMNLHVHDNTITQTDPPSTPSALSVAAGMATDIPGNTAMFTSRDNQFRNNTYALGQNPLPFAWLNQTRTERQWKAFGQDRGGVFSR